MNKGHGVFSNMNGQVFITRVLYSHQFIVLFNLSNCDFKNLRCFLTTCVKMLLIISSWKNNYLSGFYERTINV